MTRPRAAPPARLVIAVAALEVAEDDRILEIGGGRGVAADLIASRLSSGELVGIDRSAKAVAAAAARNGAHVAAGRARFLTCALEELDPSIGTFHKVLAVNVNHFWVRPAQRELQLLRSLLRPGGRIVLVYEPPGAAGAARIEEALTAHMAAAGLPAETTRHATERSTILVVRGGQ